MNTDRNSPVKEKEGSKRKAEGKVELDKVGSLWKVQDGS